MAIIALYQNDDGIPNEMEVGDPAYTGGEGIIFFSKDNLYAIKIYHANRVGVEKRRFLEMIRVLGRSLTQEEAQFLCWPRALVRAVDGAPQIGCVTKRQTVRKLFQYSISPGIVFLIREIVKGEAHVIYRRSCP